MLLDLFIEGSKQSKKLFFFFIVLDKTLNCIQVAYDSITVKFLRALGPSTKYFGRFYFCRLINNVFGNMMYEII